jgi:hypothetical protein
VHELLDEETAKPSFICNKILLRKKLLPYLASPAIEIIANSPLISLNSYFAAVVNSNSKRILQKELTFCVLVEFDRVNCFTFSC